MARARRRRKEEDAEVPMSAMIDVVFLLLIFFIITHKPLLVEAHMAINLPAPSNTQTTERPQLLEIYVMPDPPHYLLMGSKPVNKQGLEEALIGVASYDPTQTVIIKMHKEARQVQLVDLLDLCKKANLSSLNVLSLKEFEY